MGQNEVLDFLEEQYKKDSNKWFSCKDIKEAFIKKGYTNGVVHHVARNLFKLSLFNQIQCKAIGVLSQYKVFKANKK